MNKKKSGLSLYVPRSDMAAALSLGAVMIEGDSRLAIPNPLPPGVDLQAFDVWTTPRAKVIWISELLELISDAPVSLLDVAGLVASLDGGFEAEKDLVPLYVPRSDMDRMRLIPGVRWSRALGLYVAGSGADFELIRSYLTPRMRAIWAADKNLEAEIAGLVRMQAFSSKVSRDESGEGEPEVDKNRMKTNQMDAG